MVSKKWYQSKTIWLNILAVLGGLITAVQADLAAGTTISLAGLVNIILRKVTKTALK